MRHSHFLLWIVVALATKTWLLTVVAFTSTTEHVKVGRIQAKLSTNPDAIHRSPMLKPQDISNRGGPAAFIIHNPKAFNIYYGSTWTQTKINVVDNFAANIGATDYWSTLNTTLDTVTKRPPTPLKFLGSAWDSSKTPVQTNVDPNSVMFDATYVIPILQAYVTAKTIKTAGDFDLARFDLNNTIFNLMMAPGWDFSYPPGYCGWHEQASVQYGKVTKNIYITFNLHGDASTSVNQCNSFGGTSVDGVSIGPVSPHNDPELDTIVSVYAHEIFESVSDPVNGNAWWARDDDTYDPNNNVYPWTVHGSGMENGDLCAWSFGSNPSQQFNTLNSPTFAGNGQMNANLKLPVTIGTGSPYYLVQMQYVYSPPNSQCAMTQKNLPTLSTSTAVHYLSVYNAFKDKYSYKIELWYRYNDNRNMATHSYVSPNAVAYGQHMEFGKFLANVVVVGLFVFRSDNNGLVYMKGGSDSDIPFTIDSANANILVLWGECTTSCGPSDMLAQHFGFSGPSTPQYSRYYAINTVYPEVSSTTSLLTVMDASSRVVATTSRTNTTFSMNPYRSQYSYYSASGGLSSYIPYASVNMTKWKVTLSAPSKPTLKAIVGGPTCPRGAMVLPGSVVWIIFTRNTDAPTVVYQTTNTPSGCKGSSDAIGDGKCDAVNNNALCLFDGGDCCQSTCLSNGYACGSMGYLCSSPAIINVVPPTPAPSPAPIVAGTPTASPSVANMVSVTATTLITGISQQLATSPNFAIALQQSVAVVAGVAQSAVSLPIVTYSASRIRARVLLVAGATATYTITTTNINPTTLVNTLSSATTASAMTTNLVNLGFTTATASTPVINTVLAPTSNPTIFPSGSPISRSAIPATVKESSGCFAGSELVTLEHGHTKAMSDVQVGDRVLTVNAKGEQVFSDVVYLPHGRNKQRATFAQVSTESGRDLKMTMNHMLPAGACALSTLPLIAAAQVVVGDCVQTVSGREQVISVKKVEGKGIYSIIAMEEFIVVNGIVATPYGGINPTLANWYYNLFRLTYTTIWGKQLLAKGLNQWLQVMTLEYWSLISSF